MGSNQVIVDRRRGERRSGEGDTRLAPAGRERRSGVDRRQAAAVVVAAGLVVVAASADAQSTGRVQTRDGLLRQSPSPVATAVKGTAAARNRVRPSPSPSPSPAPSPAPTPTPATSAGNPLAATTWYVDPASSAKKQADTWRSTRPADAAQMDKIAATGGQAKWFGDWNADVQASVDKYVDAVTAAGAVPVMVAYNIPNRDCGQYSSGGAADEAAYRDWIRRFALGIARRPAIVVLEPDALGHLSQCGTDAEKAQRVFLLWDAVQVLKADPMTRVYIDVGHSRWLSAAVAADRLSQAGVADADGFATNVSNFNPTASEVAYGNSISALLGGKHFVVDTSRNGLGPASSWCNPGGQALGSRPTATTGNPNVDAYLWIKHPGQSDGTCNGGPTAGTWWPDYALGLAQRASY